MQVFLVWADTLLVPVVDRHRNHSSNTVFELVMVENPRFVVGSSMLFIIVPEI